MQRYVLKQCFVASRWVAEERSVRRQWQRRAKKEGPCKTKTKEDGRTRLADDAKALSSATSERAELFSHE